MKIGDTVEGTTWGKVKIVGSNVTRGQQKKWQIKLPSGSMVWVNNDQLFS